MPRKNNIPTTGIALIATLMFVSFLSTGCAESSSKRWAQLSPLIQPTPDRDRDKPDSILNEETITSTSQGSSIGTASGSMR